MPQCYEYHLFGLLRFQNEVSKLIVCFPYSLEAAEEHAYVGTEDGYIALMPIATTGETVLHHAATFDDGDVACALLSYSGAIAVARPFHWFTAVDPLNVVTPNQIATRHSIKRALSPDVSVVVGTAVNDGLALAVKSLRDAESALDDDGASYADIAEAAIASPRMDQDAKRMMSTSPTSMSKAMTYAMLLDPSFVVQLIDHWNGNVTLEDGGDSTFEDVLDRKLTRMRCEVETGYEASTDGVSTPEYDDWPSASIFTAVPVMCAYVRNWAQEGATGVVRRFGKMTAWLGRYGPNGDGSLLFNYDPELENLWMAYRTRTLVPVDLKTYMFILVFLVIDLFKVCMKSSFRDQQDTRAMAFGFLPQLLVPCGYGAAVIFIRMCPAWYSRHRETVIFAGRVILMSSIAGPGELLQVEDSSLFRRNTLFFILNIMPAVFFPIRADRHLLLQMVMTIIIVLIGQSGGGKGHQLTADNLPLRGLLAIASFVISLALEAQSRRVFTLEHLRAGASERRRTKGQGSNTKGRGDWFKWGISDDDSTKPVTTKDEEDCAAAKTKRA